MAVSRLQFPAGFAEIVDFEAEMMNAGEVRTMCTHIGRLLALRLEDGDVDIAVGQEHVAVAATQLFEIECSLVELGGLGRLLCR